MTLLALRLIGGSVLAAWVSTLQVAEPQLFDWLTKYGAPGVLAVVVIAFMFGWIVPGYIVKQKDADIATLRGAVDKLRDELLEQVKLSQQSATMVDRMRDIAKTVIAESRSGV